MITTKTKKIAVAAGVALVVTISVVAVGVWFVIQQSELLADQVETLALDQAQEDAFVRLERKVQETKVERQTLESNFLVSESDSIGFLEYVENLANDHGVVVVTSSPTRIEQDGQDFISVGYQTTGTLMQLESFIELLEVIPFISQLQSVQLRKQTDTQWEASIQINVTLLNYE